MVFPLLLLLISGGHTSPAQDGISDFLEDQGLQHLAPAFISEEIEVRQIPSIPDNYLVELGVRTMGARLRLRSAAAAWLDQGGQDSPTISATSSPGGETPGNQSNSLRSDPATPSTTSATSAPLISAISSSRARMDSSTGVQAPIQEGGDDQEVLDLSTQMANEGLAFFSITKKTGWSFLKICKYNLDDHRSDLSPFRASFLSL